MQDRTDDPIAFQFFTEVAIIEQLAHAHLERCLPDGLKVSQFSLLNHLVRLGGQWSPVRLATAFQVTKAAMTNTVKRLEARELIKVLPDPTDGRGKLVEITDAGRDMRQRCLMGVGPLLGDISQEFSDEDFGKVLPMLEKIRIFLDTKRS